MESAGEIQSSVHRTEFLLFFSLLQLSVMVLAARLFGNLSARLGNSRVVGEIFAGLVWGPSLFGQLWPAGFAFVFRSAPAEPMTILSQVGLILLLFQIGLEFDFSPLRASPRWRAVVRIALLGEVFPFLLGFAFGQFSAPLIYPQGNALGYKLVLRHRLLYHRAAGPRKDHARARAASHQAGRSRSVRRRSTTWWDGCCWRSSPPWLSRSSRPVASRCRQRCLACT